MCTSESTISRNKNNCVIVSTSGLNRRAFSELEEEIGFEPAALLLQLDYWIGNEGFERDGRRWVRMSAKTISRRAFRAWSQRKVQREIKALHEAGLIYVEYSDGLYTTPYIALNKTTIAANLKSVRVVDAAAPQEKLPAESDTVKPQPAPIAEKPTTLSIPLDNHELTFVIGYSFTSTFTAGIVLSGEEVEKIDAQKPHNSAPPIPPSTLLTTFKDIKDSESDTIGDQTQKEIKESEELKERESARSADRRGASSTNGTKRAKKSSNVTFSPAWDKFCRKLAEICGVDFDLKAGMIRKWASFLWKKGNGGAGYTVDDLGDFIAWWNENDWRAKKNKSLPHPVQVVEFMAQAYEHESSKTRRNMRTSGYDPDDPDEARYAYVFGEYADFIDY